jgi:hypothetical protein
MRAHAHPRYLLTEAFVHFQHFFSQHPVLGTLILLALYGGVMAILKWTFEEIEELTFVFGLIIAATVLGVGMALYTYLYVPGYHFGG